MPIEVTGARRGNFFVPLKKADLERLCELPENRIVKARIDKPRRGKHHRTFFGYVAFAFDNWPDVATGFEPEDADHLRAWLLCKAGHSITGDYEPKSSDSVKMAMEIATFLWGFARGEPCFVRGTRTGIRAFKAKSISYAECDQKQFSEIAAKVFEIINIAIGVPVEQYIKIMEQGHA